MTDATDTTNGKLPWNAEQGLRSDKPEVDPNKDLFKRAPFAKHMAEMIACNPSQDGLVMALYGDWGSGKSTVLEFVKHELRGKQQQGQEGNSQSKLMVMDFNPWWFSGHEDLARAFLQQLMTHCKKPYWKRAWDCVTAVYEKFKSCVKGAALGVGAGLVLVGQLPVAVVPLLKMLMDATKPGQKVSKSIPTLQKEIDDLLKKHNTRIVVFVDDVDRLLPDEIRQLFTVIKALANFSMVTYVMALDRDVAVHAVENHMGLPGERFLEKIVQVPINLPAVDKATLHKGLEKALPAICQPPPGKFCPEHLKIVQPDFSEKHMQALADKNSPTLDGWLECLQEHALHLTIDQAVNLFEWLCRVADMPPWSVRSHTIAQLMVDLSRQAKFHTSNSAGHIDAFFKKRLTERQEPGIFIKQAWLDQLRNDYLVRDDLTRWNELDALWLQTFKTIVETNPQAILDNPRFLSLLVEWQKRDAEKCKAWCKLFIASNENLLLFLSKFYMQGPHDDWSAMLPAELTENVNVERLKQFIDILTCLQRLQTMQQKDLVPPEYHNLVNLCIRRLAPTADNSSWSFHSPC